MNILLAAATEGEIALTREWLDARALKTDRDRYLLGQLSVQVCITAVGVMAATETLTRVLLTEQFDFALQAGVAGAFSHELMPGQMVCVASDALGDLGAEDRDGSFLDIYDLGLAGKNDAPFSDGGLKSSGLKHGLGEPFSKLKAVSAITVQTVSGTEGTIAARAARYGADIETMEGAPFHYCCLRADIPFVQIRAISNYVEPRNRAAWKMAEAVSTLNATLIRAIEFWMTATPGSTP